MQNRAGQLLFPLHMRRWCSPAVLILSITFISSACDEDETGSGAADQGERSDGIIAPTERGVAPGRDSAPMADLSTDDQGREEPEPLCTECGERPCPDGYRCVEEGEESFCTRSCDEALPCPTGYRCAEADDQGEGTRCVPLNGRCDEEQLCNDRDGDGYHFRICCVAKKNSRGREKFPLQR